MRDKGPADRRSTPIWLAIATALRSDIAEGRYRPGDRLPSEKALAERFDVNRHTVRRGMAQLVQEGLLRTRRGSGAFVASTPTDYPIGKRVRFHENLEAAGRRPAKRVLQLTKRAAAADEAGPLKIAEGDKIWVYDGLSYADGLPICLSQSFFPVSFLPALDQYLAEDASVTEALKGAGVADYTRVSTRLTAVLADASQALLLQIQEGDPLLRSSGINVDPDGVPVEFGRTWFVGDRITLTLGDQG